MRLMKRDLQTVYLRKRIITQDDEANDVFVYSDEATALEMVVQSAGGQAMAQIYGDKLPYMKSCKYQGDELQETQNEGDGICLYVESTEEPDYTIKSIQPFTTHKNVVLERIDTDGRGN